MTTTALRTEERSTTKRSFVHDTRAVSEVLGFMLIMGILISSMSIYLSLQVPEWTKELEAEHAAKVPHEFANLDSAIDLAIASGEPAASTECPIGMSPRAVPPVIPPSAGTLTFDPDAESLVIIAGTDEAVGSGNGSWLSTPANFSLYDKYQVITPPEGAQLNLEIGEDKRYNSGGSEYLAGEFWFNQFSITNGTKVSTADLTIHAMNITIDSTSSIIANGSGAAGGEYDKRGEGDGAGGDSAIVITAAYIRGNFSAGGGGAGFGGQGGKGGGANCSGIYYFSNDTFRYFSTGWGDGGAGGSTYGDILNLSLRSGSGGAGGAGGRPIPQWEDARYAGGRGGLGGGFVLLDAPNITIAGKIYANGEDGGMGSNDDSAGGGGGGGSGGCILIKPIFRSI